ncbi:putative lipid II flippase FtsW [Microbacterium sp. gxy059]|uniref:putative lipid II flippase FtsW n=1 Tax=Microbacterium sp. gxy059 TaxID=2957199 RepID=UPI003D95DB02
MATEKTQERTERRLLAARVSLGRGMRPVSVEFLLIASTAVLLTAFGVVMVFSATTVTSIRDSGSPFGGGTTHLIYAAVAIPAMFLLSRFPASWFRKLAWIALGLGIALQMLVFTPLGHEFGGNRNWILIGSSTLQPSEFLKLGLAVWLAFIIARKRPLAHRFWHAMIPLLPVAGLALATVMAGEDLGTTMIMALIVLGAMFFGGYPLRFILPIVVVGLAGVSAAIFTSENRMRRIFSVFDRECADYLDTCYQPLHGIWGLAGGGILGVGLGNSKEKYNWLPAAADDYIFAILGEELGLLGCVVVLALFAVLAVAIFRIVQRTDDLFVRVAAGSLGTWIIGQALVNIGVVLRVFPALGVPLPFLSSGGSSLIAILLACGVLLSFARTLPPRGGSADPQAERHKIVR